MIKIVLTTLLITTLVYADSPYYPFSANDLKIAPAPILLTYSESFNPDKSKIYTSNAFPYSWTFFSTSIPEKVPDQFNPYSVPVCAATAYLSVNTTVTLAQATVADIFYYMQQGAKNAVKNGYYFYSKGGVKTGKTINYNAFMQYTFLSPIFGDSAYLFITPYYKDRGQWVCDKAVW